MSVYTEILLHMTVIDELQSDAPITNKEDYILSRAYDNLNHERMQMWDKMSEDERMNARGEYDFELDEMYYRTEMAGIESYGRLVN